ncbi:MAG: PAS domain-containing protein [Xanthobacteraceae bacterium]
MPDDRIHSHLTVPSADRLRRAVCLLLVAMFGMLVVFRVVNLWWRHDEIIVKHRRQAESLALVLSGHLEQTIATVDAALSQLALHSDRVGGPNAQPPFWNPVLQAAKSGLAGVGSITVLNDSGLITHSTILSIIGQSRATQFLFRHMASDPTDGLVADTPFRSLINDRMIIPLGRRLAQPDGKFEGVVAATLEPEQLRNFYRSVDLGEGARISVLHPEGIVLFREPSNGDPIGAPAHSNPLFAAAAAAQSGNGFLEARLDPDGPAYLSAFRTLKNPRLILAVSLSEDAVLAQWLRELWGSALGVGVIGLLLLIAGYLINREIRARAAADAALRENRARFNEIMYQVPILISVKDTKGRVTFMNRALEQLLGTSLKDAEGKTLHEIAARVPAGLISSLDQEVIDTKAPVQRELSYENENGTRTALFVKFPLFDARGNVEAVASFSTDLTEQRRSETWFRTIMDHAPASVVLKDLNGRYLFMNKALERWLGVKAADLLGKSTDDVFPPEYAEKHNAFDREVMEAKVPMQREFQAPFSAGMRSVLFVKFPIFDANGQLEGLGSIGTDITDQKQTEVQLAHAHRMEAVGQLTGGIAHDFNNLLTVIIGNAELLAAELKSNERLQPLAQVTLDAAERSAALTQRLLAFGRRQMLEPKPTDANLLLGDMEDIIERAAGENSTVQYLRAENLWPAIVDPGQLETAILNLVVNSRDAMPYGGRVTIETANVELDESYAQLNPDVKPGDYVVIAVSDTGTGMPPEVVARVFEPFFTTKEVGKGTGLGLPTIYGFIKQSGGHVKIYSEVGHGTVVRLYIPRADAPSIVPDLQSSTPEQLPRGSETILLVEDDRLVREYTESQLVELGYRVTSARNPDEALKLAVLVGKPDLLFTDVIMPGGKNGRELAARMRERWPDLKVLCTSGYTDGAMPEFTDGFAEGLHFLAKPFHRKELAIKVREALDAPAPVAAADWA